MKFVLSYNTAERVCTLYDTITGQTTECSREDLLQTDDVDGISGDEITTFESVEDWQSNKVFMDELFGDSGRIKYTKGTSILTDEECTMLSYLSPEFMRDAMAVSATFRLSDYTEYTDARFKLSSPVLGAEVIDMRGIEYCSFAPSEFEDAALDNSKYQNLRELYLPTMAFMISTENFSETAITHIYGLRDSRFRGPANKRRESRVGYGAFSDCKELEYVDFSALYLPRLRATFKGCSKLKTVYLPDTLVQIGSDTFAGCESLTSLQLPAELADVGRDAFEGTGLTRLVFPKRVHTMQMHSYRHAQNLQEVVYEGLVCMVQGETVAEMRVNDMKPEPKSFNFGIPYVSGTPKSPTHLRMYFSRTKATDFSVTETLGVSTSEGETHIEVMRNLTETFKAENNQKYIRGLFAKVDTSESAEESKEDTGTDLGVLLNILKSAGLGTRAAFDRVHDEQRQKEFEEDFADAFVNLRILRFKGQVPKKLRKVCYSVMVSLRILQYFKHLELVELPDRDVCIAEFYDAEKPLPAFLVTEGSATHKLLIKLQAKIPTLQIKLKGVDYDDSED